MAGARVYLEHVSTRLTAQLLTGGATANVTPGDGALFAAANGTTGHIVATLRKMSGYKEVAHEIVDITNRSTDALTIGTRAMEGTTALQFEVGDILDVDFTPASLNPLESAWTAYTPTITASSGTFTSVSATGRYKQLGKLVFIQMTITITTLGTAAGSVLATLPVTSFSSKHVIVGREYATTGIMLQGAIDASSGTCVIQKYDGTFIGANGYVLALSGVYEAA